MGSWRGAGSSHVLARVTQAVRRGLHTSWSRPTASQEAAGCSPGSQWGGGSRPRARVGRGGAEGRGPAASLGERPPCLPASFPSAETLGKPPSRSPGTSSRGPQLVPEALGPLARQAPGSDGGRRWAALGGTLVGRRPDCCPSQHAGGTHGEGQGAGRAASPLPPRLRRQHSLTVAPEACVSPQRPLTNAGQGLTTVCPGPSGPLSPLRHHAAPPRPRCYRGAAPEPMTHRACSVTGVCGHFRGGPRPTLPPQHGGVPLCGEPGQGAGQGPPLVEAQEGPRGCRARGGREASAEGRAIGDLSTRQPRPSPQPWDPQKAPARRSLEPSQSPGTSPRGLQAQPRGHCMHLLCTGVR